MRTTLASVLLACAAASASHATEGCVTSAEVGTPIGPVGVYAVCATARFCVGREETFTRVPAHVFVEVCLTEPF